MAFLVSILPGSVWAADSDPAVPLELQTYGVKIEVSFAHRADVSTPFRKSVLDELRDGLDRSAGGLWRFAVAEDSQSRPAGVEPLRRVTADQAAARAAGAKLDKLYLLSIEPAGRGFRIAGREWDAATRLFGPVQEQTFPERRDVAARLVALLRGLFRPVASVSQARGGPVVLRARGGALAPHDESWQPLREGALFEVFFRVLGKDQSVERIQPIPWTYLTAGPVELGTSECTVASGVRASFKPRRRMEAVALEARRQVASTRLTLVTRAPQRRPLGGVEVEIGSHPATPGSPSAEQESPLPDRPKPQRFVTDRNGQVTLAAPQVIDKPVWLSVHSGQNLLATIPFVPGLRAEELLELPDDSLRLEVEGRLAQLQSELVDTVARRAVVAALTRNRAKTREWPEVDGLLAQLTNLPGAASFSADLSAIRLNARTAARARKDKATELRVERLCDETGVLIKEYLEDDKLKELREEVAELKQVASEEAAAAEQFKADQARGVEKSMQIDNPAKPGPRPAVPAPAKPAF